jgi:hypothetical protein
VIVRRVVLLAVLAVALVVAAVAFVSAQARLAGAPRIEPIPGTALPTDDGVRAPAFSVFDRGQTTAEKRDAQFLVGLDSTDVTTVRRLGTPEGLVVLGWRTGSGKVCEGAYRPAAFPLPAVACTEPADFVDSGLSLRWPDSPDLGQFDIRWRPQGGLELTSAGPPSGVPVTPRPTVTLMPVPTPSDGR